MQNIEQESAPPDQSKPNGRPPFEPTDEHRRQVKDMAAYGVPQKQIARFLGISPMTLRKNFRAEHDLAAVEVNNCVLHSLVHMATVRHNASAAIFWARTRCNFRAAPPRQLKRRRKKSDPPRIVRSLENFGVHLNDGAPNGDF